MEYAITPVEVFKTNVQRSRHANSIVNELSSIMPLHKINFDLHDCDKILRVEGNKIIPDTIIQLLNSKGYFCQILED